MRRTDNPRDEQREIAMLKVAMWAIGIIFIIGLLVVFGVLDLIF
jgi:hypothetical protein